MTQLLNLNAIEAVNVNQQPYPYFVLEQSINSDQVDNVMADFPELDDGGSFTLDDLEPGPSFNALIDELNGADFRQQMSAKFDLDLSSLPMIVTVRGVSRAKDGRVHTDSISKIATILIYFNQPWTADTGKLRVLNSDDIEDLKAEVIPNAGTMMAFKVTDNCWHGYLAYEGSRRSIQINFVADDKAVKKHHNRHGFTAKLKGLKKLFGGA
ncbi:MAG: hypothetical protein ACJAYG_002825 [Oceanicoccus sp.]|jgi:hypothetical protein